MYLKRFYCILVMFIFGISGFSQEVLVNDDFNTMGNWKPAPEGYGNWVIQDGRLAQLDVNPGMAKINLYVPQSGIMQYEFDVQYIDHGDDNFGAFGLHVFIKDPSQTVSWGSGKSYLLWLTVDPDIYEDTGVRTQIYKSTNNITMDHIKTCSIYPEGEGFPVVEELTVDNVTYVYVCQEILEKPLKIKLVIDSSTGNVTFYDPLIPNWVWEVNIGEPIPEGSYISLRTNSVALSFDNFTVIKLK
jgi:hypothetical protein